MEIDHRKIAIDLFNHVWTLIKTPNRTAEQDDEMVHAAHASRHHWGQVGKPENFARGEWQVSRMYTVLGRGDQARHHAQRCLHICLENEIGDWDLAFAYEALARAAAVQGDSAATAEYARLAFEAGENISEAEDKELFEKDMKSIPEIATTTA